MEVSKGRPAKTVKRGRPKKAVSDADRMRAMRKRKPTGCENWCEQKRQTRSKQRRLCEEKKIGMLTGEELDNVQKIELQYSSLWGAVPCPFCGTQLFHEEQSREKWCCAKGELFFPKRAPLEEEFYNSATFLKDIREYNNMFAFSALGVTGGFQGPPGGFGTSMVKIQGKVYHRIFDLSWQSAHTSNNSELYIDDGSLRQKAACKYIYKLHLSGYIIFFFYLQNFFLFTKSDMEVGHRTLITRKILRSGYLDNGCHGNQKTFSQPIHSIYDNVFVCRRSGVSP